MVETIIEQGLESAGNGQNAGLETKEQKQREQTMVN
jgi:hypothetical protein